MNRIPEGVLDVIRGWVATALHFVLWSGDRAFAWEMDEGIFPYDGQGVSSEGGLRGSAAERLCKAVVGMLVEERQRQSRIYFYSIFFE